MSEPRISACVRANNLITTMTSKYQNQGLYLCQSQQRPQSKHRQQTTTLNTSRPLTDESVTTKKPQPQPHPHEPSKGDLVFLMDA